MNDNSFEKTAEQAAAFQKIWVESMTKVMQAAFTVSPNSPPPEMLRNIRTGIFQALAETWDEFMRSPQFLDGMRQLMENAVAFRKMSSDFMSRVRTDLQSPSREDMDGVMLSVRHMEKRLLDRLEELSSQVRDLKERLNESPPPGNKPNGRPGRKPARRIQRVRTNNNAKQEAS
jgi:hypothetical protein